MSRIHSKDTVPEKVVRSLLHNMGYRFRINRSDLPGKPDIVLPQYRTVIEVRGCFWHRHKRCKYSTIPKSNKNFWQKKFEKNVKRDKENHIKLKKLGWKLIVVWGCKLKDLSLLAVWIHAKIKNAGGPESWTG